MKTLYALALAGLIGLAASTAAADDTSTVKPRPAKLQPIAATAGAPAAAPVKISQQDKMRLCAKQATGKKGAERKTFMKTCLSKKA
ncbi:MAG: PsiF family protein [Pseudomonadota bacterium]|nr:PsiF family protein [Pseudomonadota bacterium]